MWNRTSVGLMLGSALAGFSFWVDFLAILTLAAYEYKASPFAMASISAILLVPSMLAGPAIGRWVDRAHPAPILMGALMLRASATVLLLVGLPLPLFCVLLAARSLIAVPVEPANNVIVSRTVPKDDVPRYFGTLGLLRNASKIAAPTIGTAIASMFGERVSIGLSVALTACALVSLTLALRRDGRWLGGPAVHVRLHANAASEPSQTAAIVAHSKRPLLSQLLWTVTTYAFMVFLINNQLPVMLSSAGFDKALLGVLVSCSGAGGILAATYLSRKGQGRSSDPMRATVVSVMAIAACFVALGGAFLLPANVAPYFAGCLFFVTGVFSSVEAIRANVVVVQEFPEAVGTVSGKLSSFQSTAMLVAPWAAAVLLPYVSMSALFILDGGIAFCVLGAISGAAYWGRRRGETAAMT